MGMNFARLRALSIWPSLEQLELERQVLMRITGWSEMLTAQRCG
jgi:hypothetical protein